MYATTAITLCAMAVFTFSPAALPDSPYFEIDSSENGRFYHVYLYADISRDERQFLEPRFQLSKLDRPWTLTLIGHRVTSRELEFVATFTSVFGLYIGAGPDAEQIASDALSKLRPMKSLESIGLYVSAPAELDWSVIPELKSLTYLEVGSHQEIGNDFFQFVKESDSIDTLDLHGQFTDEQVRHLESLQGLTSLRLDSKLLTDESLRSIAKLQSLKHLSIVYPDDSFTEEGVRELGRLTSMETLRISGRFPGAALRHLRPLQRLRRLHWTCNGPLTRVEVGIVAMFKGLEHLALVSRNARLCDNDIVPLEGHRSLRTIHLRASLTRESMDLFQSIPELEEVSLSNGDEPDELERSVNEWIRRKR